MFQNEVTTFDRKAEYEGNDCEASSLDPELNGIFRLLHDVINKVNAFGVRCLTAERKLCYEKEKTEELSRECVSLKLQLDSINSKKCEECTTLKKHIQIHKRRVHDVEARLKSIAEILNIGKTNDPGIAMAHSMASQMLTEDITKCVKRPHDAESDTENESTCSQVSHDSDETVLELEVSPQLTPKKKRNEIENTSPVMFKKCSPRKKEQPIGNKGRALVPLPVNTISNEQNKTAKSAASLNENFDKGTTKGLTEKKVWNLKKSRDIGLSNKDRLKQMTLAVSIGKKQDISKIQEPGTTVPKLENGNKSGNDEDETIFLPLVTSTCNDFDEENDKSENLKLADEHKQISPKPDDVRQEAPYRGDVVKKRSERLKLPGQDCPNCYNFYENLARDLSPTQVQAQKNLCSKHRDKYPMRIMTPPGFWNPFFDDTEVEDSQMQKNGL